MNHFILHCIPKLCVPYLSFKKKKQDSSSTMINNHDINLKITENRLSSEAETCKKI